MKERTLHKDDKLKSGGESGSLILYNDDFNTFEHVSNRWLKYVVTIRFRQNNVRLLSILKAAVR